MDRHDPPDVDHFNPAITAHALTPPRAPSLTDINHALGLPATELPTAPPRSYDDFSAALAPHVETAPTTEPDDAAVKSFLTQRTDTFRAPYAPRVDR